MVTVQEAVNLLLCGAVDGSKKIFQSKNFSSKLNNLDVTEVKPEII